MNRALPHTFRAFRHANFRRFFAGQSLSLIGTWVQQVAMAWLVWRITGSAWLLGAVAFCSNIGILLLGPVAGVLADRVHKRPALILTQSLLLAQAVVLALLAWSGQVQVWHLIGCALWLGTVTAFDVPLRQTLYVHLVDDRADVPNAIALNSFMVNGARVIGPALAGALLAVVSEAVCFAINALTFGAVMWAIVRLRWPDSAVPAAPRGGWWRSWKEGARYAFGFAPVRALLILVAMLAWTVAPYSALMPVYAGAIYGGGAHTLGFLLSAAGAGALGSTIYLASRRSVRGLGKVIVVGAGASGIALAAFAYLTVLPVALVLLAVVGGGMILAAASSNTIIQTVVEDRLRGRVVGFYTMAFLGIAPLGNLAAGALGAAIGVQATFALNGIACFLTAVWFWRRLPALAARMRPTYERLGIPTQDG
jgi:MFS family permease